MPLPRHGKHPRETSVRVPATTSEVTVAIFVGTLGRRLDGFGVILGDEPL
jgi:hypothetical protein